MDRPLDPVNRSAWEKNLDRVHKSQQAAPGKNRKFAQALNDELDEEQKRQQADDAVILSDDATEEQNEHEAETEQENIEAEDGRPVTAAPEDTDEQDEAPPHIDVTA